MHRPSPLFQNARTALIAPAGPVDEERLSAAVEAVKALGLTPVVYKSCFSRHGYLAGDDDLRAHDVCAAFSDAAIDGIFCIRGGYGCQRLLGRIDFAAIRQTPKLFAGYSDITALHIALNQRSGLCTYHAPMPASDLTGAVDPFTLRSLRRALFGGAPRYGNPPGSPLTTLSGGYAEGILTGGNLSLVASSLGTPFAIDARDKILFLEEIGEEPYRIDRMLTQLRAAGTLRDCAGIVLGGFTGCGPRDSAPSLTLEQVFAELLPQDRPVAAGLACGHSRPSLTLELGGCVALDATAGTVTALDESATRRGRPSARTQKDAR